MTLGLGDTFVSSTSQFSGARAPELVTICIFWAIGNWQLAAGEGSYFGMGRQGRLLALTGGCDGWYCMYSVWDRTGGMVWDRLGGAGGLEGECSGIAWVGGCWGRAYGFCVRVCESVSACVCV